MSNNLINFLNSKNEVKLSAEDIELSSVKEITKIRDGILKSIESVKKDSTSVRALENKVYTAQKDYKKNVDGTMGDFSVWESAANSFKKNADDLGLGNQPIVQGTFDEIKKIKQQMKSYVEQANSYK